MYRKVIVLSVFSSVFLCGLLLYWYKSSYDVVASTQMGTSGQKAVTLKQEHPVPKLTKELLPQQGDLDAYYQTIIDNNIFRPLNWKPPQRVSEYTLLGTAISTDGRKATAYIQEQKTDQFHVVGVGDKIGNATVEKISKKQVTLTSTEDVVKISLSGSPFLSPRRSQQSRHIYNRTPQVSSTKDYRTTKTTKSGTSNGQQRVMDEWREHYKQEVESIRAERNRMQERLRYLERR